MNTTIMKLSAIKQNPNNPRSINKDKFAKLVKSIEEFPRMLELRPIVLNKDNIVLGGNMRLKACKHIGLTEVPVMYADDLTEEEQRQFIIKDNVGFGDWDWELLANEWDVSDLNDWGLDLPDMDVQVLEAEEDNYEEPDNLQVDVVLGDLIEIGEHRLLCGDSTDSDQVAKLMNGEKADVAHNDPPYGMKKENEGVLNDNLNYDDLLEFNKEWIALQFTHLKDNGSWYCWGIDEPLMDIYSHILKPYAKDQKLTFRNLITWFKNPSGLGDGQNVSSARSYGIITEKCLFVMMGKQNAAQNKDEFYEEWRPLLNYFVQEKQKMGWGTKDVIKITGKTSASHYFSESQFMMPTANHYNKLQEVAGGKAFTRKFDSIVNEFLKTRAYFDNTHDLMTEVWQFDRHVKNGTEGKHATPKPIPLCERAIKSSCPQDGLVLDMFLGSGSTMVAAHQLNRKCYGMELDPKYCQVIIDRMVNLDPTLEVKINGKRYDKK